jgi:hypothetical protein
MLPGWSDDVLPTIILFVRLHDIYRLTEATVLWSGLADVMRDDADGIHLTWRDGGIVHRVRLDYVPADDLRYAVLLPFDGMIELRVHEVRRIWRFFDRRPDIGEFLKMPDHIIAHHVLTLRVIDAIRAGVSHRRIGEALFGFRGRTARDWDADPVRNLVKRNIAFGRRMMAGGYRDLLTYPLRAGRQRRPR